MPDSLLFGDSHLRFSSAPVVVSNHGDADQQEEEGERRSEGHALGGDPSLATEPSEGVEGAGPILSFPRIPCSLWRMASSTRS